MRLRAHNIQIKFRVIKCPNGFPNCYLRKGIYEPCTNRRYSGLKTELLGCKVMFYSPRKIICVLPNIYTNTDEEISSRIMLVVSDLKEALEQEFEGIRIDDYEIARIQTMHVAVLNAIIAKTFLIKGLTYSSKKIAIDKSHGIPEIEITDPAVSLDYIEKLLKILENGN